MAVIRTETLTYGDFVAPFGTVVDHILGTVTDSASATATGKTTPGGTTIAVDISALAPGNGAFHAQAMDASGNPIGNASAPEPFVINPATVTVSIPVSSVGMTAGT